MFNSNISIDRLARDTHLFEEVAEVLTFTG